MGDEEYKGRCTKRTQSVLTFPRSEEFYESILIGSLSSIPRWEYARSVEEKECKDAFKRTDKALGALLESSRE